MKPSICLIGDVPPPFSGPEIGMQKLLRSRLGEKCQIHHFSFGMNTSNADRGSVTAGKLLHFFRQLVKLGQFLNRYQPDAVYYYFAQTRLGLMKDLCVTSVIRQNGRKVILHLRAGNFRRFYDSQPRSVRRLICSNLNRGDKVLVQSECLTSMFHGLVSKNRIGVLYNGLEQGELAPQKTSSEKTDALVVFFLGQLSYAKGYFDLLLTLPNIVSQVGNVRFLFAGEPIPLSAERNIHLHYISNPEKRSETVQRAKGIERTYSDYIRYLGVIDAATREKVMAQTDVFVLPTYSEGFSNAVLEAMGHGLPVVTTPVGAHPDLFRENPDALVPPGDTERLEKQLIRLLNDEALRRRYGTSNHRQVIRRYNMDHVAEQLAQAVESVM